MILYYPSMLIIVCVMLWGLLTGQCPAQTPPVKLTLDQCLRLTRAYLDAPNVEKKKALLEQAGEQVVYNPEAFMRLTQPSGLHTEKPGVTHGIKVLVPPDAGATSVVCSVSIPKGYTTIKAWPLVIGLHGGGQNEGSGKQCMDLFTECQSAGVVLVCPTSMDLDIGKYWRNPRNEVMLAALIKAMSARYAIDRNQVYLVGYSMGGIGIYYLGPRMAEHFAGVAPGAGAWKAVNWPSMLNTAVYIWHGKQDNRGAQFTNFSYAQHATNYLAALGADYNKWTLRAMEAHHEIVPNGEITRMIKWLLKYKRDPYPKRIVMASPQALDFSGLELPAPPDRWLLLDKIGDAKMEMSGVTYGGDQKSAYPVAMGTLDASWGASNTLSVAAKNVKQFRVRLSPRLVDFTKPLRIVVNGEEIHNREVKGSLQYLMAYLDQYRDPTMAYVGEVSMVLK